MGFTIHNGGFLFEEVKHLEADRHIDIYISVIPEFVRVASYNIFIASVDPEELRTSNMDIIRSSDRFDIILTCSDQILKECKNARYWNQGCIFTSKDYNNYNKKFGVSFLCGNKNKTSGHLLRKDIWGMQESLKIPYKFYISRRLSSNSFFPKVYPNNEFLPEESFKDSLFDYQYSFAIENSRENNYFTEKLIDCFYTKTIPIYWGCLNLEKFFNPFGVISFHSLEEALQKVNSISPDNYKNLEKAIDDNYKESLKYLQYDNNLERRLQKEIDRLKNKETV